MSQIRPPSSSLISRVYLPSSPPPENGVCAFPELLEQEFRIMLKGNLLSLARESW
jgi:hypothetical protein